MDKNDKFIFWSRSSDKDPGKGKGEYINIKNINLYKDLKKTKDWRKMLSNSYLSEFELDGHKWASVEHFYHAMKFRDLENKNNYNYYLTFTLDSNSPWSKDPAKAIIAGQAGEFNLDGIIPTKKIDNVTLPKNVKMRRDFELKKIDKKALTIAFFAKFSQNEELKNVLLNTKNAELWLYRRGKEMEPKFLDHLMRIRSCINKYNNLDLNNLYHRIFILF